MIVIINGAPGSGKSKTAELLNNTIRNSAWVDGDWLLRINPRNNNEKERSLRYQLIADVAKRYHENDYSNIFISFVYMGPEGLGKQIDMLEKIDRVKVFALVANEEVLLKRHNEYAHERENIQSSIEINKKILGLAKVELIDNSNISIEAVAKLIQSKLE